MHIIIQSTQVEWSKSSRGMPLAKLRNGVPKKHLLPFVDFSRKIYIHKLSALECDKFQLKSQIDSNDNQTEYRGFSFVEENGQLNVYFQYNSLYLRPKRGKHRQRVFKLNPGEYGTFSINYRSTIGGRGYSSEDVNVFYGDNPALDIFTKGSSVITVDKTEKLF